METARKQPLYLDVQASGSPGNGLLLEVAWALDDGPVHCFLVKPPMGASIPGRVRAITGISPEDASRGLPLAEAAHLLRAALATGVPTAHHASFELGWLRWLTGLPLENHRCTLREARERLPGLRSHSLRAVAGYLGISLPELRRARAHVEATRLVCQRMPCSPDASVSRVGREERLSAPDSPGVYEMLDSRGHVLYVGKSGSLKKRLASWFTGGGRGVAGQIPARAHHLRWTVCPCGFTAAMLEARMILQLDPPCNRAGRLGDRRCVYLGSDWRLYRTEPPGMPFRGPFPREDSVRGLLLAHDLLSGEGPEEMRDLIPALREACPGGGVFSAGLALHTREGRGEESSREPTLLDRVLGDMARGAFLARRGAVYRLLRSCSVHWSGGELEDPLEWPNPEGGLVLLGALISGMRSLAARGDGPRVTLSSGKCLSPDQVQEILRVV
jgi:hypothetical protein